MSRLRQKALTSFSFGRGCHPTAVVVLDAEVEAGTGKQNSKHNADNDERERDRCIHCLRRAASGRHIGID